MFGAAPMLSGAEYVDAHEANVQREMEFEEFETFFRETLALSIKDLEEDNSLYPVIIYTKYDCPIAWADPEMGLGYIDPMLARSVC